ncbi:hypothetical protein [Portibacter marinus]|uniref:hypothetical protein n=1 Tax=Portibacter marinus TaxID=2898660 RepID=UPI001F460219|nr:hypothetical protein [Portibacter marinus]
MKWLGFIALFLCQCWLYGQDHALLYSQDFTQSDLSDFYFTDSSAWKWSDGSLELFGKSDYQPPFRSPHNIAILKDIVVSDFVLEVDLKQTGREYGHRDMCLFFNINDPANFYYVHIASVADDHAHNIFLVNNEARRKIGTETTEGANWGNQWNKVKVIRDASEGTIKIYFNDMDKPIMKASDLHFSAGHIGFGSFDDTGMIDNIKLWGKKAQMKRFF